MCASVCVCLQVTSGLVLWVLFAAEDASYVRRGVRVAVSLGMFAAGCVSVAHMVWTVPHAAALAWRFARTYAAFGLGLVFYLTHWPERWWPGRFDMLGKSHQLWHLCIVLGAVNFYALVHETYAAHLDQKPCPI
jgi:adiponectin receptor